jgi:CRISPR-associated protein Csc3
VRSSNADGRWIISGRDEERLAVVEFAKYFVVEVFEKTFAGDRARIAGRQLNLLRDTCELLYRLENDQENKEYEANKKPGEPAKPEEEEENEV